MPATDTHIQRSPAGRLLATLCVLFLFANTFATRLPSPWRLDVTNDEAHHHLESWKNRYRTNDIYPRFLTKLRRMNRLSEEQLALVTRYYESGALAQRSLLVLVDPQPPLYPVMAETIEAITHSNLAALRIPSCLASILAVGIMFLLGRELAGPRLGLWLASALSISSGAQLFSGIGRPYAIAQAATILAIYTFVRERRHPRATPRRFLGICLLAQSVQWMLWSVVGPLVAFEVLHRVRRSGWRNLLRHSWWYWLLSALLLAEMFVQLRNPVISEQARSTSPLALASVMASAGPWGYVHATGVAGEILAGILLFVPALAGAWIVGRSLSSGIATGLIASFATSVATPLLLGSSFRFMQTYVVCPTILMGFAFSAWLSNRASHAVLSVILAAGTLVALRVHAAPYESDWARSSRYSDAAQDLERELQSGGSWTAYPYFNSSPLYRYAKLPEPYLPLDQDDLLGFVQRTLASSDCYVLIHGDYRREIPQLADAELIGRYRWIELIRLRKR